MDFIVTTIFLSNKSHLPIPGAQETDTDLAVLVKVGVESVGAEGVIVDRRWREGVIVLQAHVEEEEAILVGRVVRPYYHG